MPEPEPSLDELRRRIDAIDDELHDLLMRRATVVEQIRRAKAPDGVFLRLGREAQIMRRIAARHHGSFPLAVTMRIWREMLSGTIRQQGPFAVVVCAGDDHKQLRDLARDFFGTTTPLTLVGAPAAALRAVAEGGGAAVGVVPWPQDNERDPWWRALMNDEPRTPRVVARLPFVTGDTSDDRRALVIGRMELEPTGGDHGLIGIELVEDASRGRLKQTLEASGLNPVAFWSAEGRGPAPQLIEVSELVTAGDERLARIAERLGSAAAVVLPIGGFAMPIQLHAEAKARPGAAA